MFMADKGAASLHLIAALVAEIEQGTDLRERVEARLRSAAKAATDEDAADLHAAADAVCKI